MSKYVVCILAMFLVGCSSSGIQPNAPSNVIVANTDAFHMIPAHAGLTPPLKTLADSCPHGAPELMPIEKGETWAKGSWKLIQGVVSYETSFFEVAHNGVVRSERIDGNLTAALFPNARPGTRYRFEVSGNTLCGDRTSVASVVFTTDGDVRNDPGPILPPPPIELPPPPPPPPPPPVDRCATCHEPYPY